MRSVALFAGLALSLSFTACRMWEREAVPTATAHVVEVKAGSGTRHDRTGVRVSAQTIDGAVWAIGGQGTAMLRWQGDGWERVDDLSALPGNMTDLVADPSRAGELISLWRGQPMGGGDRSTLHLWRHASGMPARRVTMFSNPNAAPANGGAGEQPRLAVGADGAAWLTFRSAVVVRVASEGGAPEIITLPSELFRPRLGVKREGFAQVVFTADGDGGGWLWTTERYATPSEAGELFRPARVSVQGHVTPAPALPGLPIEGRVTFVRQDASGGWVWALENRGLWTIDFANGTATRRDSPSVQGRIMDWQDLGGGLEVALVFSDTQRVDRMQGEVWVRREGRWMNAGFSGDDEATTWGTTEWRMPSRTWARVPGGLLGSGFNQGLIAVDFSPDAARVRNLDWRDCVPVTLARRLFVLADGCLLAQGIGTTVIDPMVVVKTRTTPVQAQAAWMFSEKPTRAEDGRLWLLRAHGRGAPAVRHWDGDAWQNWPLPVERPWWLDDVLWVDVRGRVAIFSDRLNNPAWERDAAAPEGWKRWESGLDLVAARADEREQSEALVPMDESFPKRPVFCRNGDALVGFGAGLWHRRAGKWTFYEQRVLGHFPYRYGFEADGTAWFVSYVVKCVYANGVWREAGPFERDQSAPIEHPWPQWLRKRFDPSHSGVTRRDGDGVWWSVQDGVLWKAQHGEAVQYFPSGEPSPFAIGTGKHFQSVLVDARGNRLFADHSESFILVPARPGPVVKVTWLPTDLVSDRSARVSGGPLWGFEWRLDRGVWGRGEGAVLTLRELPVGTHVVEIRGFNRELDAGPVVRCELTLDYDPKQRVHQLLTRLQATEYAFRTDAVQRLGLLGAEAGPALQAALATETDESRRWWLRAALQAMTDRPDKTLTTP